MKTFYRAKLPHIQPIGGTFFITFRLHNSLPKQYLRKIKLELDSKIFEIKTSHYLDPNEAIYSERKLYFKKMDWALDQIYDGTDFLKEEKIAQIVRNRIHQYDGELYDLLAYCIMPNHVHLVFDTSVQLLVKEGLNFKNYIQVSEIMRKIKGGSAFEINKILNSKGEFWQRESYDHYVRSGQELKNVIDYVIKNPVVAKLAKEWDEYKFTYLKEYNIT
ncbi:MAG: transposase [Saprospiraceae bacterium]